MYIYSQILQTGLTAKKNVIVDIIERVERKFDGCADFIFTAFIKPTLLSPFFPPQFAFTKFYFTRQVYLYRAK